MLKTKVGYSVNTDSYQAGIETAEKINKLGNVKLGLLFTSCKMDHKKVVEGVKSVIGNRPIIGCTSSEGIIVPDGLIEGDNYAGMMGFRDDNLVVGTACSEAGAKPREIGKKIAREAITKAGIKKVPSYFYMIASPKEEEEYLLGIQDVIGAVPFFGGSASGEDYKIICNDKVISDGCAVAFFYSKNELKNIYTGSYQETSNIGLITKVDGNRKILEIDREPALKRYASWLGVNPDQLMGKNLENMSVLTPLGVKDHIGSITAVRHPLIGNPDYSMVIGNHVAVGTAVILLNTTVDDMIKANSETLKTLKSKMKKNPAGYFLIHSVARKRAMGARASELYDDIGKILGLKEFIMIFTSNEYGASNHSADTCAGLTLSYTCFSEQ